MSACTLDALTLADFPPFGIAVGDICSVCYAAGAPLKVSTFIPVDRGLRLASEHRACPACEALCVDAAHAEAAKTSRHLVRTLRLHGHRDFHAGLVMRTICDTSAA